MANLQAIFTLLRPIRTQFCRATTSDKLRRQWMFRLSATGQGRSWWRLGIRRQSNGKALAWLEIDLLHLGDILSKEAPCRF